MNWSSVKNLLIAILIGANIFMLFNIARQDRTRNYIDDDEIANAVELLKQRGLVVPISSIPKRKFKAPIYESFYDDSYHEDVAKALVGEDMPLYMQPDGGLSGTTTAGVFVRFDTEFGFVYSRNDKFSLATYTDVTADNFHIMAQSGTELGSMRKKDLARTASDFLNCKNADDSTLTAQISHSYVDPTTGLTYLLAHQIIDELEVHSHFAVCVFEGDELIAVHGRWYFAALDEKYETDLHNQVNILFTDLQTLQSDLPSSVSASLQEDFESNYSLPMDAISNSISLPTQSLGRDAETMQVVSMTNAYVIYWNSDKTALYFIPAWQITHIGGNTIVYNAANGTVYTRN